MFSFPLTSWKNKNKTSAPSDREKLQEQGEFTLLMKELTNYLDYPVVAALSLDAPMSVKH